MDGDPIISVESNSLSASALTRGLELLKNRFAREEFVATLYSKDELTPITVRTQDLFPLTAVKVATGEVTVVHGLPNDNVDTEPFVTFLCAHPREAEHTGVWWGVRQADELRAGDDPYDFEISAGWSDVAEWKAGYFWCGPTVHSRSPGARDIGYRRDLFERVFESMGVGDVVTATIDGGTLRVVAEPPWRIRFRIAGLHGEDPHSVAVCGFANIDAAFSAAHTVLEHISKKIIAIRFSSMMAPETFHDLVDDLNETAVGWKQDTGGMLTPQAAKVLETGITEGVEPQLIPVMHWLEESDGRTVDYYHLVVSVTEDGPRLQLTSDCGDVDELLKRAAVAGDLKFRPVP